MHVRSRSEVLASPAAETHLGANDILISAHHNLCYTTVQRFHSTSGPHFTCLAAAGGTALGQPAANEKICIADCIVVCHSADLAAKWSGPSPAVLLPDSFCVVASLCHKGRNPRACRTGCQPQDRVGRTDELRPADTKETRSTFGKGCEACVSARPPFCVRLRWAKVRKMLLHRRFCFDARETAPLQGSEPSRNCRHSNTL